MMIAFLDKERFFMLKEEVDMKNLTGNQIRQLFLDYFKKHGHMIEPGASLTMILLCYGSMPELRR